MGPCLPNVSNTLILPTDDEAEEASWGTLDHPMMKAQQKQEQIDPVTTQTMHGTIMSEVEPSPLNQQTVDVNWTKGMRTTVGQGSTEIEMSVAAAVIPCLLYLHVDALLRGDSSKWLSNSSLSHTTKPSKPYAFSDLEDGMYVLGVDCLGDGPKPGLRGNGRTGGFDGETVEVDGGK